MNTTDFSREAFERPPFGHEDTLTASHTPDAYSPIVVSVLCRSSLVRAGVAATLDRDSGFVVRVADDAILQSQAALLSAMRSINVVIADYDSAMIIAQVLRRGGTAHPPAATKVMIVSQRDGEAEIRQALERGIQGYLPLDCRADEMADGVVALHRGKRFLGRTVAERVAESFDYEALSSREIEVLRFVVAGDANKVIARKLNIALGTVKVHVRSIISKLAAKTRTEAAAVARRRGLLGRDADPEGQLVAQPAQRGDTSQGFAEPPRAVSLHVVHQRQARSDDSGGDGFYGHRDPSSWLRSGTANV